MLWHWVQVAQNMMCHAVPGAHHSSHNTAHRRAAPAAVCPAPPPLSLGCPAPAGGPGPLPLQPPACGQRRSAGALFPTPPTTVPAASATSASATLVQGRPRPGCTCHYTQLPMAARSITPRRRFPQAALACLSNSNCIAAMLRRFWAIASTVCFSWDSMAEISALRAGQDRAGQVCRESRCT